MTTGRMIVTAAVADFVLSAFDVAVTDTCAGLGMVLGAVYSPEELIVPHALPLQPEPVTLHATPVLLAPVTVAENWRLFPRTTWAVAGEMLTATAGTMVTVALADLLLLAAEVAVTVT